MAGFIRGIRFCNSFWIERHGIGPPIKAARCSVVNDYVNAEGTGMFTFEAHSEQVQKTMSNRDWAPEERRPLGNTIIQLPSSYGTLARQSSNRSRQHCFGLFPFVRHVHNESRTKQLESGQPGSGTGQKKGKKGGRWEALDKLQRAKWALYERKLPEELRDRNDVIKSEAELVGVVEQRIQQSMREGEFDKLPGHGKPLEYKKNPHIDAADDLAYRVLGDSGFAPEWVTLNKVIREATVRWRAALKSAWLQQRGASAEEAARSWEKERPRLEIELAEINRKILHYNLITPFGRQMMGRKMERELEWLRDELRSL